MSRRGGAAPWLALVAAGCLHGVDRRAQARPEEAGPERAGGPGGPSEPPRREEGLASFYADGFQGRATASGAPYDREAFTCAHRTWPFGTRLRVTALDSGRSVVVTVTDRGPHRAGRIVDLSRAAARALGVLERGLARVRVEPGG